MPGKKSFVKGSIVLNFSSFQVPMQDVVSKKLVGVVSFREGCADLKYPEVYARVAVVRDWIELQLTAESMNTQR